MKVSIAINTKKDYDLDKYDAIVHIRPKDRSKSWYEETVECKLSPIVENRPKGKWIKGDMFECDLCHHKMIVGDGAYNYCPNCGADMRGEE